MFHGPNAANPDILPDLEFIIANPDWTSLKFSNISEKHDRNENVENV
jgi:hypothetical protein